MARWRLDAKSLTLELALYLDGQALGFSLRAGPRGEAPPAPAGVDDLEVQQAIESKDTITLLKATKFVTETGAERDVDKRSGGGLTEGFRPDQKKEFEKDPNQTVVVSGNSYKFMNDVKGKPLRDEPADILLHELVGHAIPRIVGSDTGDSVKNENKARMEERGGRERAQPIIKDRE